MTGKRALRIVARDFAQRCALGFALSLVVFSPLATMAQSKPERVAAPCVFGPGGDCSGRTLAGLDLRNRNLRGMNFAHADLRDCDFRGADLGAVNFEGANLRRSAFAGAYLGATVFDRADMLGAFLRKRDLLPSTSMFGTIMPNGLVCDLAKSQGTCVRTPDPRRVPFLGRETD